MDLDAVIGRRAALTLCLLCLAFFLDALGSLSVFTAGPAIQADLGLTQAGLQWTFTAATLPAGALLLLGGRLADLYGRRRMFMTGSALLVVSSFGCGVASTPTVLLAGRAGQGIAAAVLAPAALSLVMTTFPSGRARTVALAVWSAIGGVGATLGLLLGGLITVGLGWRWVFWINVPIGILALVLTPVLIHEPVRPLESRRLDGPGTVTATAALALLVYGISAGPEQGWLAPSTTVTLVAGLLCVGGFAWVQTHSVDPMIPRWLLRSPAIAGGNLVLLTAGVCADGLLFILTLFTQRTLHYSAVQFGAVTATMTVVSVGGTYVAQHTVGRLGARRVAATSVTLLGLAALTFAGAAQWSWNLPALAVGMSFFGLGMGGALVAGSVAALADVPATQSGVAAGVKSLSFGVGTTLGVAGLSTVAAAAASHLTSVGVTADAAEAGGQRAAFLACALIALLGCAASRLVPLDSGLETRPPNAPASWASHDQTGSRT